MNTLRLLASRGPSDRVSYRLQFMGKGLLTTSRAPLDTIFQIRRQVVSDQWSTATYAANMLLAKGWAVMSQGGLTFFSSLRSCRSPLHTCHLCVCLQLCVSVYMCDVCMEASRCFLLPLFLYIMKLWVLSYYKAHNFIMYKKNGNKSKNVFK